MRIISGINYYYKLDKMIQECITKAKENPFDQFIFIAEDKKMIEKRFFQYTHYLVNIEIMTWNQYLKSLQFKHHLTHHKVIDDVELTYHLLKIFNQQSFHCFHSDNYYPIINEIMKFIKDLELNQTIYHANQFNNPKLIDLINIYNSLKEKIDINVHLSLESLINTSNLKENKQYLYIEADHLYQPLRQTIIKKLSQYHDITLLYTYTHDKRSFNLPYQFIQEKKTLDQPTFLLDNLFLHSTNKCKEDKPLYTFIASTPQNEVKRVIYTILEMIADQKLKYEDFMVVYPDNNYIDILIKVLEERDIPHNLRKTSSCIYDASYQFILKKINELDTQSLKQYANIFINENIDNEYKLYFESLVKYEDMMTNQEFKEFFINTYKNHHSEKNTNKDVISIVSIDKVKSDKKKHIFMLGMNETVLPAAIKDTGLLLDEDIEILKQNHIPTPFNTSERLGLIHNEILKALQCPYHTLTISYCLTSLSSDTKLPSSLYKQLIKMYDFKPLPKNKYISIDDFYLKGGKYDEKEILNDNINHYKEMKNQPVMLDKEIIKELYNPTLSVSQIETYNKCPYLYFIQYGLGIYSLKEDKLMPNELGSLVHYILSMNLDKTKNTHSLINYYLSKNEDLNNKIQSSYINQYFLEQLEKDIEVTLDVLNQMNDISKFKISSKEEKVEDEILGMNFKGFVDRIDTYNQYVSIIDYKSSTKDIDLNLAMQGFNIQMLLYLKMITKKYNKDPGAVLYFNTKRRILTSKNSIKDDINKDDYYSMYRFGGYVIDDDSTIIKAIDPNMDRKSNIINVSYVKKDGKYKGHILTHQQLQLLLEEIEKHIYELYLEMINGHIDILPKGSDDNSIHTKVNPCRYCEYKNVCHFDIFYNDYKLVEFYDLNEKLGGE